MNVGILRDRYFCFLMRRPPGSVCCRSLSVLGIRQDATLVRIELGPFNDRALNRDLAGLCEWVNQASPPLPDGRRRS
jgi:hypothetical protein